MNFNNTQVKYIYSITIIHKKGADMMVRNISLHHRLALGVKGALTSSSVS